MLPRDWVRLFLVVLCSVSGMSKAFPAMKSHRRQGIAEVLLGYLKKSASVINQPGRAEAVSCTMWLLVGTWPWTWNCRGICWNSKTLSLVLFHVYQWKSMLAKWYVCWHPSMCLTVCRQGIQSDAEWLEANFGSFSQFTTYSDLKFFNISGVSQTFHD